MERERESHIRQSAGSFIYPIVIGIDYASRLNAGRRGSVIRGVFSTYIVATIGYYNLRRKKQLYNTIGSSQDQGVRELLLL